MHQTIPGFPTDSTEWAGPFDSHVTTKKKCLVPKGLGVNPTSPASDGR